MISSAVCRAASPYSSSRIGDRWTALIVGVLEDGPRRFGEIRDAMGTAPKVLTQTLRALERDGLVTRTAYSELPPAWSTS